MPLTRSLQAWPADLLHVHWVADIFGANDPSLPKHLLKQLIFRLDVRLAKRLVRGHLVWTVHNLTSHECLYPNRDLASRRFLARQAERLIVHSAQAKTLVAANYRTDPGRIAIVPLGDYRRVYGAAPSRSEARQQLGIPNERIVFLCLGALRPYKGIQELLVAFRRLPDPRKHLIIAGAGRDQGYISSLRALSSAEAVTFLDRHVEDSEVPALYAASDVVVLPFKQVLTSSSLILAMGFGKMIIAPRLGCIPDYLDQGGGILYDPTSATALQEALVEAMAWPDREAPGRHNQDRARHLSWAAAASATIRTYDQVMNPTTSEMTP